MGGPFRSSSRHARHESAPPWALSITPDTFFDPAPPPPPVNLTPKRNSSPFTSPESDLSWPFCKTKGLDQDDIRDAAFEIFFSSCRSCPGFGGRHALAFYSSHNSKDSGESNNARSSASFSSPAGVGGMGTTSKIKRALGLKPQPKRVANQCTRRLSIGGGMPETSDSSNGSGMRGGSPTTAFGPLSPKGGNQFQSQQQQSFPVPSRTIPIRKPLTSAEIMRIQMRITEQSDSRLRKTLMRTLVGQAGRRADTMVLPLELIRNLKPTEFVDSNDYHFWQRRQLRVLEAGLIHHPSSPNDSTTTQHVTRLEEIIRSASESKPIDTSRTSDELRALCTCVAALACRTTASNSGNVCHWADGYPLNIHIYVTLLQSLFDLNDETVVLDEVDELIDLMKKTWPTLALSQQVHNVCFTWVLFNQYVLTGQVEPDLLCAAFAMLNEVARDAKKNICNDGVYVKTLRSVLRSMVDWTEKKFMDYHQGFPKGNVTATVIENLLPLAMQAKKILEEDVTRLEEAGSDDDEETKQCGASSSEDLVESYIRSSLKNAFKLILDNGNLEILPAETEERVMDKLNSLAELTEDLAAKEKENYSNMLKRWHPVSAGIAAVTLHTCYGDILRQYLSGVTVLTGHTIRILQRADKLEKVLVQMVVEDTVDCDDGGKSVVREMVPYEVESVISKLLRKWIDDKLENIKDCVQTAKENEKWNPKSKTEPFAQSAVELMKICMEIAEEFFKLPICISDELVQDLADGLEGVIRDFTTFVAACGTKQNYLPSLPPLTRCNRDSKFSKLWRKASCSVGAMEVQQQHLVAIEAQHTRPTTSRGTQRIYIRLNTLHHLLSHLNSLDKTLSLTPRIVPPPKENRRRSFGGGGVTGAATSTAYFELARASMHGAITHVAEVAAYRLIFLDSHSVFYESLFSFGVVNSRIKPAVAVLGQNLTLLSAILMDTAQPLAVKEIMKASFEAFLMVLLAGGSTRIFCRTDGEMIAEDFDCLKGVFCASDGTGTVPEDEVKKEAEVVEGVIELMGETTEKIVEDFSTAACESSGVGVGVVSSGPGGGSGQKLPMPPTTGKWDKSDPNTVLRVLCYRNDHIANSFLKKTFHLPKRK